MKILTETTIYGKKIFNIKDFIIDLRERIENIIINIKLISNKEILLAYLTGAIIGILNRLNRVCEIDYRNLDIIPKFQHNNARNERELVENLCTQTNFVFFSNFNLNQDSIVPTPKYDKLQSIIKNLLGYLICIKKQLDIT